ncbi:MAG TPA: serine/threonine-protein kinase, partial [Anaeromyxobacter sp.]
MAICGKCHREAPEGALFCSFCGGAIKPVTAAGEAVDPLIGQTVAQKYFIHQLLGHGGMGDVYKATHLTLDRPVVLKLLKKLFHSDPSLVQRFHREARAASRLNHPNSITIIDFGQTDDGTLFMAMEYLSGRSLERVVAEEHPLAESRVIHIVAQILAALGEAHALGIIHRDLKPANVMIEPRRDEPDFVKVLDFGIAKLNEPGSGGQGLTQAGIVCGTPGYMSPEQVRGEELDPRSDIYAVGVILYEMLTGVLPFESDTPMGLVTKHLVEDPPPLAVRRPGTLVSPELEAVIMKALARDREQRFASSDEMRAAVLACGAPAAAPIRPTPPPSSTIIFDPATLGAPAGRPPSGPRPA